MSQNEDFQKDVEAVAVAIRESDGCGATLNPRGPEWGPTVFCDDPRLPREIRCQCLCRDAARAALTTAIELGYVKNPWRPIETAPKDGSEFLGWHPSYANPTPCSWHYSDCFMPTYAQAELARDGATEGYEPTHWKPLAPPPEPKP